MVDLEDLQVGELMHNLRIRYVNHDDRGMMYYTYASLGVFVLLWAGELDEKLWVAVTCCGWR